MRAHTVETMLGFGLRKLCRGSDRLLWQQLRLGLGALGVGVGNGSGARRLDGSVALSSRLPLAASVAPQPRRALCSAPSTEDILWDYYQHNKPTKAPEEILLPEIYERDAQLEDLARDAESAFNAYKKPVG